MGNAFAHFWPQASGVSDNIIREIEKWEAPLERWADKYNRIAHGGKMAEERKLRQLLVENASRHVDLFDEAKNRASRSLQVTDQMKETMFSRQLINIDTTDNVIVGLVLFVLGSAFLYAWTNRSGQGNLAAFPGGVDSEVDIPAFCEAAVVASSDVFKEFCVKASTAATTASEAVIAIGLFEKIKGVVSQDGFAANMKSAKTAADRSSSNAKSTEYIVKRLDKAARKGPIEVIKMVTSSAEDGEKDAVAAIDASMDAINFLLAAAEAVKQRFHVAEAAAADIANLNIIKELSSSATTASDVAFKVVDAIRQYEAADTADTPEEILQQIKNARSAQHKAEYNASSAANLARHVVISTVEMLADEANKDHISRARQYTVAAVNASVDATSALVAASRVFKDKSCIQTAKAEATTLAQAAQLLIHRNNLPAGGVNHFSSMASRGFLAAVGSIAGYICFKGATTPATSSSSSSLVSIPGQDVRESASTSKETTLDGNGATNH